MLCLATFFRCQQSKIQKSYLAESKYMLQNTKAQYLEPILFSEGTLRFLRLKFWSLFIFLRIYLLKQICVRIFLLKPFFSWRATLLISQRLKYEDIIYFQHKLKKTDLVKTSKGKKDLTKKNFCANCYLLQYLFPRPLKFISTSKPGFRLL